MEEHVGSFAIFVVPDSSHRIPDAFLSVLEVTNIIGDEIGLFPVCSFLFTRFSLGGLNRVE